MTAHNGGCHCGNIRLTFASGIEPGQIEVRACQCSFCLRHGSLAVSDPSGALTITIRDAAQLQRYMFGLRTAEYLVCRECGVYVAAVTRDDDPRAIVIINALDDRQRFDQKPIAVNYDLESTQDRLARRRARWMPVAMRSGNS
jgi:hypothetical protein